MSTNESVPNVDQLTDYIDLVVDNMTKSVKAQANGGESPEPAPGTQAARHVSGSVDLLTHAAGKIHQTLMQAENSLKRIADAMERVVGK